MIKVRPRMTIGMKPKPRLKPSSGPVRTLPGMTRPKTLKEMVANKNPININDSMTETYTKTFTPIKKGQKDE